MKILGADGLTGKDGSLDMIPDIYLVDGDMSFTRDGYYTYWHRLSDDSGQVVNHPYIIAPIDTPLSDKRWLLQGIYTSKINTDELMVNTIASSGNITITNPVDFVLGASFQSPSPSASPIAVDSDVLVDNLNAEYLSGYRASDFISNVSGRESIPVNVTSMNINLPSVQSSVDYKIFTEIENTNEMNPSIYSTVISQKNISGFTVSFSGIIDSVHYRLNWFII